MNIGFKDDEIFLLSIKEYKRYKENIPELDKWWWLRSPGFSFNRAARVGSDASAREGGLYVDRERGAVRPALKYSNLKYLISESEIADEFILNDVTFVIIDKENEIAITEEPIKLDKYDDEDNDYKSSYIRKFLLSWLDEMKAKTNDDTMKIVQTGESEFNVVVEGKGHFNVMVSDWGGDYPGVDIEYISEKGMKDTASKPRVMFELGYDSENPTVRVWEDPDSEDHTYDHTFDMGLYEPEPVVKEKTKIYMINGYSKTTGCWEVELLSSKAKAVGRFNSYVKEYEATISPDDDWYASCDDGVTWMSLEERVVED